MESGFLLNLSAALSNTSILTTVGQTSNLLPAGLVVLGDATATNESLAAVNDVALQNLVNVEVSERNFTTTPTTDTTTVRYKVQIRGVDAYTLEGITDRVYADAVAPIATGIATDLVVYPALVGATPYIAQAQSVGSSDGTVQEDSYVFFGGGIRLIVQIATSLIRANDGIAGFILNYDELVSVESEPADPVAAPLQAGKSCPPPPVSGRRLTINYVNDVFGGNFSEIYACIRDTKKYPGGYPRHLVAKNIGASIVRRTDGLYDTFFSLTPPIVVTLKGEGEYDLQRVEQLYSTAGLSITLLQFYKNVLSFGVLKYTLAGLITGCFKLKWFYSKYNARFFKMLAASEFASLITLFEPYVGYEQYYRWSPDVY